MQGRPQQFREFLLVEHLPGFRQLELEFRVVRVQIFRKILLGHDPAGIMHGSLEVFECHPVGQMVREKQRGVRVQA